MILPSVPQWPGPGATSLVGGPLMRTLFMSIAAAVAGSPALAADLHVPGTFATIQAAIDAAAPSGDRVLIADGTYAGPGNVNLDLAGKSIVIESANGAASTIIDGAGSPGANAFLVDSGEPPGTRIEGLTIRNFLTGPGNEGAIRIVSSTVEVKRCVITQCATALPPNVTPPGSAIKLIDCSPVVRECTFTFNQGSVIHTDADSVVYLIDSTYEDNVARVDDDRGGAAVLNEGFTLTFDSFYRRNRVEALSGVARGGAFAHLGGTLDLTAATFEDNEVVSTADRSGAAVYAVGPMVMNGNIVKDHGGGYAGGTIHIDAAGDPDGFQVFSSGIYDDNTVGAVRISDPDGVLEVRIGGSQFCGNDPFDITGPFFDWGANSVCCPADLNGNGGVDFGDVLALIAAFGTSCADCPEDLNGDGGVSFADILVAIGSWGPCPELPAAVP
jgi:hypothetical protein